jgi:hypothetical protein
MEIILTQKPCLIDISRTSQRTKLRVADQGSPGRLWLCMVFDNDDDARSFAQSVLKELDKHVPTGA